MYYGSDTPIPTRTISPSDGKDAQKQSQEAQHKIKEKIQAATGRAKEIRKANTEPEIQAGSDRSRILRQAGTEPRMEATTNRSIEIK